MVEVTQGKQVPGHPILRPVKSVLRALGSAGVRLADKGQICPRRDRSSDHAGVAMAAAIFAARAARSVGRLPYLFGTKLAGAEDRSLVTSTAKDRAGSACVSPARSRAGDGAWADRAFEQARQGGSLEPAHCD